MNPTIGGLLYIKYDFEEESRDGDSGAKVSGRSSLKKLIQVFRKITRIERGY